MAENHVTYDEVIAASERLHDVVHLHNAEIKYGYDSGGHLLLFVKRDSKWFRVHTKPPNPSIVVGIKALGTGRSGT